LLLNYEEAYITGSYDSESYRSLANDTHCNWDVQVKKRGNYQVRIELKSKLASSGYILQVGEDQYPVEVGDHTYKEIVGSLNLDKSESLKVSVFPAESKSILSNGAAGFNRLMLEDVTIKLALSK
ncbi:MAG: hypothetical protein KAT15_25305, partial [Bacteroidales bacterium]|nr:hypothetical protein [Bacteroidales bacterium]